MNRMKGNVVALLVDVVSSREGDRRRLHRDLLRAAEGVNAAVPPLDPLRPTVADELQGVYSGLGEALRAWWTLRLALLPTWDVRCGIGGGEVRVIDAARGIQDGSAWWRAREAIDWVAEQAGRKGYASARSAVRDARPGSLPQADALVRLVDAQVAGLREGAVGTLRGLWEGLDNAEIAQREKISESANSQRVINNGLRPLVDAMRALGDLS